MKRPHQPSRLHRGLELLIDPHWSPKQRLAVIELLDDLHDRIWAQDKLALVNKLREERVSHNDPPTTDRPF